MVRKNLITKNTVYLDLMDDYGRRLTIYPKSKTIHDSETKIIKKYKTLKEINANLNELEIEPDRIRGLIHEIDSGIKWASHVYKTKHGFMLTKPFPIQKLK